jgi:hypothetical protein
MLTITAGEYDLETPFLLHKVAITATLVGHLAQVDWLVEFENIKDELVQEATVTVPTPEGMRLCFSYIVGSTVCAYATDILGGGQLVDAVIVSKETGRKTYEGETRNKKADSHSTSVVQQHLNTFKTKRKLPVLLSLIW